jgi:uncharacterized cupin superfamily protein
MQGQSENKAVRVIRITPETIELAPLDLDPADFQSALPVQNYHVCFSDEALGLAVGIWDTTTMQEAFGPYPGDEFIVVLEGSFAMLNGKGGAVAATAGQSVCFRNAIPTSWKQDGYLKKVYLTWRDPAAETPVIASADGGVVVLDPLPLAKGAEDRIAFANDSGNMTVAIRWVPVGDLPLAKTAAHQLVRVLAGRATILDADGRADEFAEGDIFFVPLGTICRWSVHQPLSLHMVTLSVPSQAGSDAVAAAKPDQGRHDRDCVERE